MRITLWLTGSSSVKFEVKPTTRIEDFQEMIEESVGIRPSQMSLSTGSATLELGTTFQDYGTPIERAVWLSLVPSRDCVFINTHPGNRVELQCCLPEPINGFKRSIKCRQTIDPRESVMYFDGNALSDDHSFTFPHGKPAILDLVPRFPDIIILIKNPSGFHLTLAVEETDLVESVKSRIQNCEYIPCEQQRLSFHGQELEDGYALRDYSIQDRSVIDLSLSTDNTITIIIQLPTGSLISVPVPENGRVNHIKGHLEVTKGFIRDEQTLSFKGRTLKDDDRLQECSIPARAIIDLELRCHHDDKGGLPAIPDLLPVFVESDV
jgi:hypothetical protein